MLVSRRDFAIGCATAFALAMLAGCSNSHGRGDARPSASALPSSQQEGAPYPADMAHLSQIPSLKGGLEDIDLRGTSNPWNCGLGQANVLFECPFGGGLLSKVRRVKNRFLDGREVICSKIKQVGRSSLYVGAN